MPAKKEPPEIGSMVIGERTIPFTVVRSKRRRRTVAFTMESPSMLRIVAPMRTTSASLHAILQKHARWIARRLSTVSKTGATQAHPPFTNGMPIKYLGHNYRLRITHDANARQSCRFTPRMCVVNIPDADLSPESLRDEVRLEIMLWLKKRARTKLKKRMDYWAKKMGVSYRQLILSNPERRWGSCTAKNVIRLNWRLIMAPLPLIDYVAAHELSHVPHKNHSPRFWGFLEKVMPDYSERRKELRLNGHHFVI